MTKQMAAAQMHHQKTMLSQKKLDGLRHEVMTEEDYVGQEMDTQTAAMLMLESGKMIKSVAKGIDNRVAASAGLNTQLKKKRLVYSSYMRKSMANSGQVRETEESEVGYQQKNVSQKRIQGE